MVVTVMVMGGGGDDDDDDDDDGKMNWIRNIYFVSGITLIRRGNYITTISLILYFIV